jgi:hypothetical protein
MQPMDRWLAIRILDVFLHPWIVRGPNGVVTRSQAVGRSHATTTIRWSAANSVPTRHDIQQVSFVAGCYRSAAVPRCRSTSAGR